MFKHAYGATFCEHAHVYTHTHHLTITLSLCLSMPRLPHFVNMRMEEDDGPVTEEQVPEAEEDLHVHAHTRTHTHTHAHTGHTT